MRIQERMLLTPFLSLATVAVLTSTAHANVLLESRLAAPERGDEHWTLGMEFGGGLLKGGRKHDIVRRYHGLVGFLIGYQWAFVKPSLEYQYLEIDTNRSKGTLRSAKLRPENDLEGGRAFKNIALGLALGGVVPSDLLDGLSIVRFGASVEGRTTILRPRLKFDELVVLYESQRLEMEELGNENVEVTYRLWTITEVAFITLQVGELDGGALEAMRRNAWLRPLADSAFSIAFGATHFILDIDVEIDPAFAEYVSGNQDQRVRKDKPVGMLRYALPITRRVGFECIGSASKNTRWVYTLDGMLGVRF